MENEQRQPFRRHRRRAHPSLGNRPPNLPSRREGSQGQRPFGPARPQTAHGGGTATRGPRPAGMRRRDARRFRERGRISMPVPTPYENGNSNGNKPDDVIPPLAPDTIRVIPLGGVEEIGRNMSLIEFGNDIIVVDCGFQFREDDTPGIDYILPNTKYLEERKDKIKAVVITHGHLDHIGGIPYIMPLIGNPPIYSRRLTTLMIKKRQEEFPHVPSLDIREVEKDEVIKIGGFTLKFFAVTHTIPDSMGVIVGTPYGAIVHTGDLKLEHENNVPVQREEEEFAKFQKEKVLLLMADSTNVERPGFSIPEQVVFDNIEQFIKEAKGRIIIGTFSSQLERICKIIEIAEKYKKKIVVEGRSMKVNIEIVKQLKILKAKKETFISAEEMAGHPGNRIMILATGAQGDEFAALMRISNKTHKNIRIEKTDTVILSSSIIPGNERAVQKLKDNLSRQGAKIIHYQISDVHSSGHANRDETAWIHKKINAKFFVPLHGYHYMLRVHADIARFVGLPDENIIIADNGTVIEIRDKGEKMVALKEKAPSNIRMVDGFAIGDIQEVVIRDRKALAQDGMFVIIATVNLKTGKLRKSPDIISRGFVYLRESQELLQQTRLIIKKNVEQSTAGMNPVNFDYIKNNLTDAVERFLFEKTNKRPLVIPVLLGV